MTTLLHIDASILGENSVSRVLSAATVAHLRDRHPGLNVVRRDLAADPLPHLTGAEFAGFSSAGAEDAVSGDDPLAEFLAADIVVIGLGLYNFSIPSQLKAWIDRIVVAGRTFRYTENGPLGLAGDKRVILTIARGGHYGADTPMASFEHAESYLRVILGFIGVAAPEVIVAEGIARGPEVRASAMAAALEEIGRLAG